MTTSPYDQAIAAWLKPKSLRTHDGTVIIVPNRERLLAAAEAQGRYPSPEEEAALRGCADIWRVPEQEWGAVCLVARDIRFNNAETALGDEASAQIAEGERFLDLGRDDFLHWPWRNLDGLVGGMAPGTLHFVVCPSKGGKTTLCRSATAHWIQGGHRVYYAGFEMTAPMLRTMLAADDVGVNPGDVTSGAWTHFAHHAELKERMRAAYRQQEDPASPYANLRFSGFSHVTVPAVQQMLQQAADWGAKVVIIDHVDHVSSDTRSEYANAIKVCDVLDRGAKEHGLVIIATSQMNTTGKSQDLWRDHRPLRFEHVNFGGVKVRVATTMIGLRRPLKPGMTREERAAVEAGDRQLGEFLWPFVNAANVIDSRTYGERKGHQCFLGWDRGRIVDPPPSLQNDIDSAKHGIRTARGT